MVQAPIPYPFELLLFHRSLNETVALLDAGADAAIIDFESRGKALRQQGYDTEINAHTVQDLRNLRAEIDHPILCRLSGPDASEADIAVAIDGGADEIIIPMVRHADQVARIRHLTKGCCRLCVMIETGTAAEMPETLGIQPQDRVYVGLNDLHIDRKTTHIFAPLADGLLSRIKDKCGQVKFGFGGLTLPGYGAPLPATYLIGEMARLGCEFSFLRRSFYRDIQGRDAQASLAGLRAALAQAQTRAGARVAQEHADMVERLKHLKGHADV